MLIVGGGCVPTTITSCLAVCSFPFYTKPPYEASMLFMIRPYRRFPVQCAITYNNGLTSEGGNGGRGV